MCDELSNEHSSGDSHSLDRSAASVEVGSLRVLINKYTALFLSRLIFKRLAAIEFKAESFADGPSMSIRESKKYILRTTHLDHNVS